MSKGPGVVQREILDRLALLRQPSLPALWHPLTFEPYFDEISFNPNGSVRLRIDPHSDRGRAFNFVDHGKLRVMVDDLRIMVDDLNRRSPPVDKLARNRLWWQFDVGRVKPPGYGMGYTLGMLSSNDSRARRSSVHRAIRSLRTAAIIDVDHAGRAPLIRLHATEAEKHLTDSRLKASNQGRQRYFEIAAHLELARGYDRTQPCVAGGLCSGKKHMALERDMEVARLASVLGGLQYPWVWSNKRPRML